MSTRSTISVQLEDKSIKSVYCHFDGYLSHNGMLLKTNFNSQELAEELISMGSLSSLNDSIETSVFYCRDRQEELSDDKYDSEMVYRVLNDHQEYNYCFIDGEWKLYDEDNKQFISFTV